ncbi:MAG: response regulator transcription factor [Bacteroidetes bacterium]|nr:response regulator transcription factor [Bacteroidota bacterium]
MPEIKVIIADDHPLFRLGLVSAVKQSSNIILCGEAENGGEALSLIRVHEPDVAILDVEMPLMNGLQVCETVCAEKIKTKVLILTFFKEKDLFENAMSIGAWGYLLKDNAINELVAAIEAIAKGDKYISPTLKSNLIKAKSHLVNDPVVAEMINKLSITEKNILLLIAEEKTTKEIAAELFVSEKTIENHRYNIVRKLNLESGKNNLLKFALSNKAYFK